MDQETHHNKNERLERDLRTIETILRKTITHTQRPRVVDVLLWATIAYLSVTLGILLLAAIVPSATVAAPWLLAAGLSGVTVGLLVALYRVFWKGPDLYEIAAVLQREDAALRHDLVSALRFGHALRDGGFDSQRSSPALASLHVHRVANKLMELQSEGHLAELLPTHDIRPALWGLVGLGGCVMMPFVFATEWTTATLTGGVKDALVQMAGANAPEQRPVMGNLSLRMRPPEYTGLAEQMELFTTGSATVIEATYIGFDGFVLPVRAKKVELVTEFIDPPKDEGQPQKSVRSVEVYGGGRGRGGFVARQSLRYWFRAELDDGTLVEEGIRREITVKPDDAPQVNILSHEGQIEVSTDDVLELEFNIKDDFGLTEFARVTVFEGSEDEKRKPLDNPALESTPLELMGAVTLDLSEINLQPRDRLVVYIEAVDNNTLSGPGVGRSEPIVLYVSSPDDKHMKNIEAQQELLEALFLVLADYLETPLGTRVVDKNGNWSQVIEPELEAEERTNRFKTLGLSHQGAGEVYKQMGELVEVLKQDPLMVERDLTLFSSLYDQLIRQHRLGGKLLDRYKLAASQDQLAVSELGTLARWSSSHEEALEKGILRLEDLLFAQQAKNVEASMKEIRKLQERLKELLKEYKETQDPKLKEAIMREVQRLRSRMRELSRRMQSQIKQLPAEHVNREAIEQKQMENSANKVVNDFDSIEDLLEKGDIDGALEALEQLGENLEGMEQMVSDQFGKAEPDSLSEFDKKMSELIDDANDLNELQKGLEKDTEDLQRQIQEEQSERMEQQLKQLKQEISSELKAQEKALKDANDKDLHRTVNEEREASLDALKKVQKALEQNDVEQALEQAEKSLESLDTMRFQAQMRKRFKRQGKERQALEGLDKKMPAMRNRADSIADQLSEMMDQGTSQAEKIDPRATKLAERQEKIQQRAEQIQKKIQDASKQYPGLQEELDAPMRQSQKSMDEAKQGLKKQHMQKALDEERQAIETLRKLKESMQESVKKERQKQESGQKGTSQEKVKLPGSSKRNKPVYRELLQDGMKEDRLQEYESDIDRYYKSLGN